MGDFHLWSAPTLAEFHRTPTSCRASEYNLPALRATFSLTFSPRLFFSSLLLLSAVPFCGADLLLARSSTRRFEMQPEPFTRIVDRLHVCGNTDGIFRNFKKPGRRYRSERLRTVTERNFRQFRSPLIAHRFQK